MSKSEQGVSVVIASVFMILVTGVIAAIIFGYVSGAYSKPPEYYTTRLFLVQQLHNGFTISFHGNVELGEEVTGVKIYVNSELFVDYPNPPQVGQNWVFESGKQPQGPGALAKVLNLNPGNNNDHLVVVGVFSDGYEQVLVDTFV